MRIRKNLNLTPSMIWSTAATPECPEPPPELMQPHICALNRAPWDAPLSPPSSHQLQAMEEDDSYLNTNGTFFRDDSLPTGGDSTESMKISSENDNTGAIILHAGSGSGDGQIATGKESATPARPTATRKSNDDNSKKNTAMGPPKRRGRPRKPPQTPLATSSDPNEFYYYSGFGPRWGKRRGSDQNPPAAEDNAMAERSSNGNKKKDPGYGGSSSSYPRIEETDYELDFIDDDFDDEDDDDEYGGPRKRARKPVKARSLKSLM